MNAILDPGNSRDRQAIPGRSLLRVTSRHDRGCRVAVPLPQDADQGHQRIVGDQYGQFVPVHFRIDPRSRLAGLPAGRKSVCVSAVHVRNADARCGFPAGVPSHA